VTQGIRLVQLRFLPLVLDRIFYTPSNFVLVLFAVVFVVPLLFLLLLFKPVLKSLLILLDVFMRTSRPGIFITGCFSGEKVNAMGR